MQAIALRDLHVTCKPAPTLTSCSSFPLARKPMAGIKTVNFHPSGRTVHAPSAVDKAM